MEKLIEKLQKYQDILEKSLLWKETLEIFGKYDTKNIKHIRCLALGSPSESNAALYQLAILEIIGQHFQCRSISVYDPVFTELDKKLFDKYEYMVTDDEELVKDIEKSLIIYFLPHAELALTEKILVDCKPRWLLANYVLTHTDSFTKKKLYEEYKTLAYMKHSIEMDTNKISLVPEFEPVISKKSRRMKKNVYIEPKIDYNYEKDVYFTKVEAKKFEKLDGEWGNSFSDLAFHSIIKENEVEDKRKEKEI